MTRFHAFRVLVVVSTIALALVLGLSRSSVARAATCQPTGVGFTAVLVNPTSTVTGSIDATGCDFGVYVGVGHHVTISGADIFNANFDAVAVDGSLSISNSHLHQTAAGILLNLSGGTSTSASISATTIDNVAGGIGQFTDVTSVSVSNTTINAGTSGIRFDNVSRATLTNNTVSNASTGIQVGGGGTSSVVIASNILQNDSTGIATGSTTAAQITHNSLSCSISYGCNAGVEDEGTNDVISYNTICGGFDPPIDTSNATNPVVSNNTIKPTC